MDQPKISIICGLAHDRAIGNNNQLLWHIPEDLKHFKEITTGHPIIMGQKTYESIGRPLPNRTNIVLSQDSSLQIDGCIVCGSIDQAIVAASEHDQNEIFIIGGGSIYKQTIDLADKLYLTIVDGTYEADTFFPDYSEFTKVIIESETFESNNIKFKFVELERG